MFRRNSVSSATLWLNSLYRGRRGHGGTPKQVVPALRLHLNVAATVLDINERVRRKRETLAPDHFAPI